MSPTCVGQAIRSRLAVAIAALTLGLTAWGCDDTCPDEVRYHPQQRAISVSSSDAWVLWEEGDASGRGNSRTVATAVNLETAQIQQHIELDMRATSIHPGQSTSLALLPPSPRRGLPPAFQLADDGIAQDIVEITSGTPTVHVAFDGQHYQMLWLDRHEDDSVCLRGRSLGEDGTLSPPTDWDCMRPDAGKTWKDVEHHVFASHGTTMVLFLAYRCSDDTSTDCDGYLGEASLYVHRDGVVQEAEPIDLGVGFSDGALISDPERGTRLFLGYVLGTTHPHVVTFDPEDLSADPITLGRYPSEYTIRSVAPDRLVIKVDDLVELWRPDLTHEPLSVPGRIAGVGGPGDVWVSHTREFFYDGDLYKHRLYLVMHHEDGSEQRTLIAESRGTFNEHLPQCRSFLFD